MAKELYVYELIKLLKKHRGLKVKFNECVHYSDMLVDVSLDDFEVKDGILLLPNLCACYPEPE